MMNPATPRGPGMLPGQRSYGNSRGKGIALLALFLFFAVFFGLLVTTENFVLIGIGVALVLGPVLLLLPNMTMWVILIVGLLFGVLTGSPQFSKLTWVVSLLGILLLLPSMTNLLWSDQRKLPGFMLVALLFLFYSLMVTALRWYSLEEFMAGFKRYFQTFGVMLALTLVVFKPQDYQRWLKFLLVIGLLQLPFALYELLVLVPLRGGLAAGSDSTDVIAGTFGANLEGGSPNSVMVMCIFMVMAFLGTRWRAGLMSSKLFYALGLICMIPLGMGETKIAVILLPMVAIGVLRKDLMRAPLRYLPTLAAIGIITAVLGYLYVVVMMNSTLSDVIDLTIRYNAGNQGYSKAQSLNRITSVTFWFQQQRWDDIVSFLIGHGIGSSYTSATMVGHMGMRYLTYGINLTTASTLLWDTGILGLGLYLGVFVMAWTAAGRLLNAARDATVKADALAIQATIPMFMLSFIYSNSLVELVSFELMVSLLLGYLGYLINQQRLAAPQPAGAAVLTAHA